MKTKQETIRVSLDYFNDDEQAEFSHWSNFGNIEGLVETGVEIPTSEFLTYWLSGKRRRMP